MSHRNLAKARYQQFLIFKIWQKLTPKIDIFDPT